MRLQRPPKEAIAPKSGPVSVRAPPIRSMKLPRSPWTPTPLRSEKGFPPLGLGKDTKSRVPAESRGAAYVARVRRHKQPPMSEIYANAIDSLRIGIEYFLKESTYSSRKHAILTLFHAIELFLKEQLHRTNHLLIYKNIDTPITENSQTVGIKEALSRLENLGLGLPKQQRSIIENIQRRRNRIEHHRYDHRQEDETVIAESLQFILFFVDSVLRGRLEADIPPDASRDTKDGL